MMYVYAKERSKADVELMSGRKSDAAGNYSWLGVLVSKCENTPGAATEPEKLKLNEVLKNPFVDKGTKGVIRRYYEYASKS